MLEFSSIAVLLATGVAVAAGQNIDTTKVTPEEVNAITQAQQGNPNFASVLTNSTLLAKLGSPEQQHLILPNMPPELPPIPAPPAPPAVGPCAEWSIPLVSQKTLWSDFVYWDNVLPDYPRPHLRRNEYSWLNLNGRWEFQGTNETMQPPFNQSLQQCILVPFPMESDLSGIRQHYNYSFYRRTFKLPAAWNPSFSRIILHSTRVDWEASYFVNGAAIGIHRGGYDAHSFDITKAVTSPGVNEIIVRVEDLTEAGPNQPLGKQRSFDKGGDRIVYTSVSGIWGSIWLEGVPATSYIVDVEAFTDLDSGTAKFTVATSSMQQIGQTHFMLSLNNQTLGPITNITYQAEDERTVNYWVSLGSDVQSWSPDFPNQYTVNITIDSGDFVMLDFAFHKIKKTSGPISYLRFNNQATATFLLAPLYQGYFPDGLYTMTTPQQAKAVVDIIKSVGFNAVRIHGKVENPWFYHFADKLGLYILQDIPSPCGLDPTGTADGKPVALSYFSCWTLEKNSDWNADSLEQFQTEVAAIVRETRKHPSIVAYVAYNEGWGELPEEVPNTMQLIGSLAPNKLVNEASGWIFHGSGDFVDIHQYMDGPTFAQNADPTSVNNTFGFSTDQKAFQQAQPDAAAQFVNKIPLIGEFGGVGRWIDQHVWKNLTAADVCVYNCDVTIDDMTLTDRILTQLSVIAARAAEGKTAGAVYTQLNDVENEVNGFWTYDFQHFKLTSLDALKEMFDTIQNKYAQAVKF